MNRFRVLAYPHTRRRWMAGRRTGLYSSDMFLSSLPSAISHRFTSHHVRRHTHHQEPQPEPQGHRVRTQRERACSLALTSLRFPSFRKGLHVFSISFKDKNGKEHEIIIGPEKPEDAVKDRRVGLLSSLNFVALIYPSRSSCTR